MQKAKDAQSGFQQAVKLYRRGDLRRALAQCQSALKLQPRSVPGLHLLGAIQLRLGEAAQEATNPPIRSPSSGVACG